MSIGACNTIFRPAQGDLPANIRLSAGTGIWYGDNSDSAGFSASLLEFLKKENLKRQKVTIIGAGGAARAAAAGVYKLGGKALILNRTMHKARNIATEYNFRWGGLDSRGVELMAKYSNIIVQATSVGMEGFEDADPLELYTFRGDEYVMDLIYTPAETRFLERASAAGCKTINGYDMVIRQACMQYVNFMGQDVPHQFLSRIRSEGGAFLNGDNSWNKIRTG